MRVIIFISFIFIINLLVYRMLIQFLYCIKSHSNNSILDIDRVPSRSTSRDSVRPTSEKPNKNTSQSNRTSLDNLINSTTNSRNENKWNGKSTNGFYSSSSSSPPSSSETHSPLVNTAVQTQSDIESESPNVKEIKSQLETLKSDITRLQDAQSNLEKSLKETAALRPFFYGDFQDPTTSLSN
jgi:hypothetical protein